MHTPLCRHASGEPVDYAAQAVRLGLSEIGFSDHAPMQRDDFDDWRMRAADLESYVQKVEDARRAFPGLTIKLALEVDYLPGYEDWIRDLANRYPWDYFIGSVHYVSDSWAIDNPHMLSAWKHQDPSEVWSNYFQRLAMAAESRLFDVIGHVDLCKRFCIYPKQDWMPLVEPFLAAADRAGTAIELNTAGLRKDCREIYPHPRILRRAAELRVPITFGSDAHAPAEVGMNFADAVQLARSAGYFSSCQFTRRQKTEIPLPS